MCGCNYLLLLGNYYDHYYSFILLFDDRNGVKAIRSTFLVVEPTFLELEVSQTNYDKAL